eukprot:1478752-Rhodomonas_salina.2
MEKAPGRAPQSSSRRKKMKKEEEKMGSKKGKTAHTMSGFKSAQTPCACSAACRIALCAMSVPRIA